MMTYAEIVSANMPRIEIDHTKSAQGVDTFDWRVAGNGHTPMMAVVGAINRIQAKIDNEVWIPECDEQKLLIVFNPEEQDFDFYLHPDIPTIVLSGMLEMIKDSLVTAQVMRMQEEARKSALCGPDGRPLRR